MIYILTILNEMQLCFISVAAVVIINPTTEHDEKNILKKESQFKDHRQITTPYAHYLQNHH